MQMPLIGPRRCFGRPDWELAGAELWVLAWKPRCCCLVNGGAELGADGVSALRHALLVAEDAKQLSSTEMTGLAVVICSATRHPDTHLLLLMYK